MWTTSKAAFTRIRQPADVFVNVAILSLVFLTLVAITPARATENLLTCADEYAENIDYFPEKISVELATGFQVEYFDNYKLLTVSQPWRNASPDAAETYLLVQCGTSAPEGYEGITQIEVPVRSFAALSTTYLPFLPLFGVVDALVAVADLRTIHTPEILFATESGRIAELAPNYAEINLETILALQPTLTMTYGFGYETDGYHRLRELGLTVALNGEFAEGTPLARAEWGKFISLFFNQEAAAQMVFDETRAEYEKLRELANDANERPTVFLNSPFQDVWYMAGGRSFMAQFLADAGGDYLWAADESVGSLFLDFETVFERAAAADIWLNVSQWWFTLDDALAEDSRYAHFAAFASGQIWSNNLALNEAFGNDFFESGSAFPELVLRDLVSILHPQLLPTAEHRYYRQLGQ